MIRIAIAVLIIAFALPAQAQNASNYYNRAYQAGYDDAQNNALAEQIEQRELAEQRRLNPQNTLPPYMQDSQEHDTIFPPLTGENDGRGDK